MSNTRTLAPWALWRRILGTWALLAIAMTANGIFRELVLRPALDVTVAAVASAALGIALLLAGTRWLFPPLGAYAPGVRLAAGGLLVGLTVAFETFMGRVVDHRSWADIAAHYALWRGELWLLVLACFALTPFMWGQWWPPRSRAAA